MGPALLIVGLLGSPLRKARVKKEKEKKDRLVAMSSV